MRYCLIVISAIISLTIRAQQSHLFSADTDLSSSLINEIFIDSDNMIWAATEYGLNRYDGNRFHRYYNEEGNPHSISNNFVQELFEDSHHRLFVATKRTVQLYDPRTDSFSKPATYSDGTPFSSHIAQMLELPDGRIVSCGDRLSSMVVQGDSIIVSREYTPTELQNGGELMLDKGETFWIHVYQGPLYKYNLTTRELKEYDTNGVWCTIMCRDFDGNAIFISSTGEVFRYYEQEDAVRQINKLSNIAITQTSACVTHDGKILVGSDGTGLKSYDPKSNTVSDVILDGISMNPQKLKVHTIIEDNNSTLWLGIFQSGVIMYPQNSTPFHYMGHKSYMHNHVGSNAITALAKDNRGYYWVGTDNDGLYRLTPDRRSSVHYDTEDVPSVIKSLYEDSRGRLWYGSYGQGFGWIDKDNGRCYTLPCFDDMRHVSMYDFLEDDRGRLWIATLGSGLQCYDLKTETRRKKLTQDNVINRWINKLHIQDDVLWVGSYDGLCAIDLKDTKHINGIYLRGHVVYDIAKGPDNSLWIGTSVGLISMDAQSGEIKKIASKPNVPRIQSVHSPDVSASIIYSIEVAPTGHLWMGTNHGLFVYSPSDSTFTIYNSSDGVQEGEFSNNTSLVADGYVWFGGMGGITYFKPSQIHRDTTQWSIFMSQFSVLNDAKHYGDKSGDYQIMNDAVFRTREFHLSKADNSFSMEFASRDMCAFAQYITYSYKLNDEPFISLPNNANTLTFNNLQEGENRLIVQGNCMGNVSIPLELAIVVHGEMDIYWWLRQFVVLLALLIVVFQISKMRKPKAVEASLVMPVEPSKEEKPVEAVEEDTSEILPQEDKQMQRILSIINKHLSDPNISIAEIADEIGISIVHLNRRLKEQTGDTTSRFIRNLRLEAAAKLLKEKEYTIAEVATKVGFPDANYFSTTFKDKYGVSPKDFIPRK